MGAAAIAIFAGAMVLSGPSSAAHFADAANASFVSRGNLVYMQSCSSCHGRKLQGQPLWQLMDQYAGRRAPAHDASGHTWQHSDEDLFSMTAYGHFSSTPPKTKSYMPAFHGVLSDHDILAALAFIKSRWPIGLRASQAMLNPGFAGMPPEAKDTDWKLPPNCSATVQR
jgi:mono/diheme cytochrome c family protein